MVISVDLSVPSLLSLDGKAGKMMMRFSKWTGRGNLSVLVWGRSHLLSVPPVCKRAGEKPLCLICRGWKGWGVRRKPRAKSLIMNKKHTSQSRGEERSGPWQTETLDCGFQCVCSSLELAEAAWPATNAGRSRACSSLASWEQGQLCGLRCL